MRVLVTGAAGFIGNELSLRLLNEGHEVVGIDDLNDYYPVELKMARLERVRDHRSFTFVKGDIADRSAVDAVFAEPFSHVVNLAAQAGVRYSLKNPASYVQSNLVGFANLLEACRATHPEHFIYASSSSVYGLNGSVPYSTADAVDHPVSLYAATKKANEAMAHSYSHLFGIPCTGLRFFTVYGPWGRPDMAYSLFADAILHDRPINVFNHGKMRRDFTYIDDIVEGVMRVMVRPPSANPDWDRTAADPASSSAPWRIYNIGNNQTEELETFIAILEEALGRKAQREYLPMQDGDVEMTYANIDALTRDTGFMPTTTLAEGLPKFVEWYRAYHKI